MRLKETSVTKELKVPVNASTRELAKDLYVSYNSPAWKKVLKEGMEVAELFTHVSLISCADECKQRESNLGKLCAAIVKAGFPYIREIMTIRYCGVDSPKEKKAEVIGVIKHGR